MKKFSKPLVIKELGYKQWEVQEDFTFTSEDGLVVPVNKGFRCDLASVPRYSKSIVDTPAYWTQAAVVHDKLYDNNRRGEGVLVTRKRADQILIEGMEEKEREYDVSWRLKRKRMVYWAVRLGGGPTWKPGYKNRNNQD